MNKPRLYNLINRYNTDKELLKKYSEKSELLQKRIERTKDEIIDYVTSDEVAMNITKFNI